MLHFFKGSTPVGVAVFSLLLGGCASTSSNGGSGGSYNSTGGNGTGGSSTGGSAGSGTGGTAGTAGQGSGGTPGSGGSGFGGAAGSGGKCSKPGTLHTKTIYCPFSAPAGSSNVYCTPGSQHCCEGLTNADLSVCQPLATACTSGWTDWVCQKDSDCGSGMQCCASATMVKNTNTSCANYASGFHATQCETSCASGEIHMCTADADCGSGKTCLPFDTKGAQVGGCYPQ